MPLNCLHELAFRVRAIFLGYLLGLSEIFLIFVQISVAVLARL